MKSILLTVLLFFSLTSLAENSKKPSVSEDQKRWSTDHQKWIDAKEAWKKDLPRLDKAIQSMMFIVREPDYNSGPMDLEKHNHEEFVKQFDIALKANDPKKTRDLEFMHQDWNKRHDQQKELMEQVAQRHATLIQIIEKIEALDRQIKH